MIGTASVDTASVDTASVVAAIVNAASFATDSVNAASFATDSVTTTRLVKTNSNLEQRLGEKQVMVSNEVITASELNPFR